MEQQAGSRENVLNLITQKEDIEREIADLTLILEQNGVGMVEPLVDNAGFPISSIDTYQVRHARHRIICLQNDHKAIMKQIERGLESYYGTTNNILRDQESLMEVDRPEVVTFREPFVKVNLVSPNSPAEYAGIQVGDEIVQFGSINQTNFKNILDIATLVQHSEGSKVVLKLKRGDRFLVVQLIPKKWTGRGLLGCNIVPI